MYPIRSSVRIKATYNNRILSGGVSYAPFRRFVLLKNTLYMVRVLLRVNFFKNIFHVSDRVRVHVCVIISNSLKPYQNFGPDLSPACLLMFSVVVHDQRDRQFQNRPRVFYQVARVVSVAMTRENNHYI